jgi:hypothetical protein
MLRYAKIITHQEGGRSEVRRTVSTLIFVVGTLCLPVTAGLAADAPVPADKPAVAVASAVWPDGFRATQAQAFQPSGDAEKNISDATATPADPSPAETTTSPTAGGSSAREDQVLAVLGALFLVCVGWRTGLETYRKILLWLDAKALGVRRIVSVEEVDQDAVLSPAAVHERGWPLELMVKLLGAPDYAVVDPNGRIPPLILLSRARVEKLEKSEKFRKHYESQDRHTKASAARVSKWIALHGGDHALLWDDAG